MSKARQLADLGNVYDDGALSNRNRIINGAMVIDQRNGGSALTVTGIQYGLDRFQCVTSLASSINVQQVSDAPTGFSKSMKVTSNAATTVGASDYCFIQQHVEGYNCADFAFGTSNAKQITLSFWVKSSLTGDFGVIFYGNNDPKSRTETYTINSVDTWEYKTITIDGETSGTWYSDNRSGLQILWELGAGSSVKGAVGSWADAGYLGAEGATALIATNGATFYLTGVQLEVGDTATPFEHEPYGVTLQKAQRYFQKSAPQSDSLRSNFGMYISRDGTYSAVQRYNPVRFVQTMRVSPTVSIYDVAFNDGFLTQDATNGKTAGVSLLGDQSMMVYGPSGLSHLQTRFGFYLDAEL